MKILYAMHTQYVPTEDDRLWLCRAVDAEGEPRGRVAETLVNGFMWARCELGYGKNLASWVRAYAQPVNPRWFPHGDLFLAQYERAEPAERTELMRRAMAREDVHSRRQAFGPDTLLAVEHALTHAPQMPSATDYAANSIVRQSPWVALTPIVPGRNRFWTRPAAIGWAGYRVGAAVASSGLVLVCAALAYAIWRTS